MSAVGNVNDHAMIRIGVVRESEECDRINVSRMKELMGDYSFLAASTIEISNEEKAVEIADEPCEKTYVE